MMTEWSFSFPDTICSVMHFSFSSSELERCICSQMFGFGQNPMSTLVLTYSIILNSLRNSMYLSLKLFQQDQWVTCGTGSTDYSDLHPASVVAFRHVGDYFVMLHTEFLQEKENLDS